MGWHRGTRTLGILTILLMLIAVVATAATTPLESVEREPWRVDPAAALVLVLLLAWYARGAWQMRGPRGLVGRATPPVPVGRRYLANWNETVCFLGGWTVLAIAFFSPLDTVSGALFSAHVLQHELMLQLAVPLMILGRPRAALLQALPPRWAQEVTWRMEESTPRGAGEMLAHPWVAWSLHMLALWTWLMPAPFDAAMRHGSVHAIQHFTLIGTGLLLWWSLLYGPQRPVRRRDVALLLFMFVLGRISLGALMVTSGRLWYQVYQRTTQAWGFAPIEDQDLGAVALWVPAMLIATLLTVALYS